ncbi:MAG: TlyA family RNA methyltransferase [Thermosulfidibacteraceae bacterium]
MGKGSTRERIDLILVDRGLVESRQKAQALIMEGRVKVNGILVTKAGAKVPVDSEIEIIETLKYVSRGGLKLEHAIEYFGIDVKDKVCLDVGASTGGFTHCLLVYGARKVYALDVGYGLLHSMLRKDPRVVVIERTNFRYFPRGAIAEDIDLITVDVSFISVEKLASKISEFLREGGEVVILVKPQFEVGREKVGKGGIVRDEKIQMEAVQKVKCTLQELGFEVLGVTPSPIKGVKGNQEYLLYAKKR